MNYIYKEFDNKAEMISYLKIKSDDYFIFGEHSLYPKSYCCVMITLNNHKCYCGIINENPFQPDIILINDMIYLGINDAVYIIKGGEEKTLYKNNTCFFEFKKINNSLLAIFETSIICFCDETIKWDYQLKGIVSDYSIQDGLLLVEIDSCNTKLFSEIGLQ